MSDVKSEEKDKKEEEKKESTSTSNELEPEDLLWIEILKTLDKLEKGVEGDLSALGRATRNINRFRKRFPSTTWVRIIYTIIPNNYRKEFQDLIVNFINDLPQQEVQLISNLAGVSTDDAQDKLKENDNDVFKTLMDFIAEKEKLAKIEIKRKQEELKKEREARYALIIILILALNIFNYCNNHSFYSLQREENWQSHRGRREREGKG